MEVATVQIMDDTGCFCGVVYFLCLCTTNIWLGLKHEVFQASLIALSCAQASGCCNSAIPIARLVPSSRVRASRRWGAATWKSLLVFGLDGSCKWRRSTPATTIIPSPSRCRGGVGGDACTHHHHSSVSDSTQVHPCLHAQFPFSNGFFKSSASPNNLNSIELQTSPKSEQVETCTCPTVPKKVKSLY